MTPATAVPCQLLFTTLQSSPLNGPVLSAWVSQSPGSDASESRPSPSFAMAGSEMKSYPGMNRPASPACGLNPVSTTATTTLALPVVVSQAAKALIAAGPFPRYVCMLTYWSLGTSAGLSRRSASAYSTSACVASWAAMSCASPSETARSRATTCAASAIGRTYESGTPSSAASKATRLCSGIARLDVPSSLNLTISCRVIGSVVGAAHSEAVQRASAAAKPILSQREAAVSGSNIQVPHAQRIGLDELAARLDFLAHQGGEYLVRSDSILDLDPKQAARLGIHRGFPELLRIHFAQALVALDRDGAAGLGEEPVQRFLEGAHGCAFFAAAHRRPGVYEPLQHVARGPDLRVIAAADEVGVETRRVRRSVPRANDHQPLQLRLSVVACLNADFRIGNGGLQCGRALRRGARIGEIELHARQQCVQRRRIDQPRHAVNHRFRKQILARDVLERFGRECRPADAGDELGALHRDLEQMLLQVVIVFQIRFFLALLDLVQRRLRDVDVPALDQVGHLAVEKRQQQRSDVRAVDISVGHDDDAVIAQLVDVVLVLAEARSQRGDQGDDFLRADQLLEPGALDVEDLAAQRKDRLELAVAPLLGRSARRIAL